MRTSMVCSSLAKRMEREDDRNKGCGYRIINDKPFQRGSFSALSPHPSDY